MMRTFRVLFLCSLLLFIHDISAQEFKIDPTKYFSDPELSAAHVALKEDYMTREEQNVFLYCNLARMYPSKFVEFYKEYLKTRTYLLKDYQEGNKFYTSLIRDLKFAKPVGPLLPDKKMYSLAKCWAEEAGVQGWTGHDRKSCDYGYQGENCSYGYSDGLDIVMQLMIDKDVESLGHRKSIMNEDFIGMGVAIRFHKRYTNNCVQNFSTTNDQMRKIADRKEDKFEKYLDEFNDSEKEQAKVCQKLEYLNQKEKDIYYLINLMRLYPQRFKKSVWDKWEDFGPDLKREQHADHHLGYEEVAEFLSYTSPRDPFIPSEKLVSECRCSATKWLEKDPDYQGCLTGQYGWKLDTFHSEGEFIDQLKFLTEANGGNVLILNEGIVTILDQELFSVKTIIIP
jgi:hypothetical protein